MLDCRLASDRWGTSGPLLLLVHAIGFDRRSWHDIAPALGERFQVAAVDLPGHGESDKPGNADYGLLSQGERLVAFLDELGWDDAILVGNSLGGGVSLAAALHAPERVRGLVLLNSVGFRGGLPLVGRLGHLPLAPAFSSTLPALAVRLGLAYAHGWGGGVKPERCVAARDHLRNPEGRSAFFRTLRQLYGADMDTLEARYGEVRCPTLVLHGVSDPLISLSHARELAERIPPARLVELPRCGHFPQEQRPDAVLDQLLPFLENFDP